MSRHRPIDAGHCLSGSAASFCRVASVLARLQLATFRFSPAVSAIRLSSLLGVGVDLTQ